MKKSKKISIASISFVCLSLLVGCQSKPNQSTSDKNMNNQMSLEETTKNNKNTTTETVENESPLAFNVTPSQAVETFKKQFPNSNITKIGIDFYRNQYHYDIEGVDNEFEYEIELDVYTNKIIKEEKEPLERDDIEEENAKAFELSDAITYEEAIKIAVDKYQGEFYEWTLEKDNGTLIYEISLIENNRDFDVYINATSGEILGIDD